MGKKPELDRPGNTVLRASVDLTRFEADASAAAALADAPRVLGPCVHSLHDHLAPGLRSDETLRIGQVLGQNGRAECTVYVTATPRIGAAAIFRWKVERPAEAELTVGVYSGSRMRWIWGALGLGFVIGVLAAMSLVPASTGGELRLVGGLLLGVGIGLALVFLTMRLELGLDSTESRVRANHVCGAVNEWLSTTGARR